MLNQNWRCISISFIQSITKTTINMHGKKRREPTKFYKTVCESKSHPNNPFPLWIICWQTNSYHPILSPFSIPLTQQKDKSKNLIFKIFDMTLIQSLSIQENQN